MISADFDGPQFYHGLSGIVRGSGQRDLFAFAHSWHSPHLGSGGPASVPTYQVFDVTPSRAVVSMRGDDRVGRTLAVMSTSKFGGPILATVGPLWFGEHEQPNADWHGQGHEHEFFVGVDHRLRVGRVRRIVRTAPPGDRPRWNVVHRREALTVGNRVHVVLRKGKQLVAAHPGTRADALRWSVAGDVTTEVDLAAQDVMVTGDGAGGLYVFARRRWNRSARDADWWWRIDHYPLDLAVGATYPAAQWVLRVPDDCPEPFASDFGFSPDGRTAAVAVSYGKRQRMARDPVGTRTSEIHLYDAGGERLMYRYDVPATWLAYAEDGTTLAALGRSVSGTVRATIMDME